VHAEAADVAVDPGIAKPAGEWAGWLAREIATHGDRAVRDADAQGLDVTRPIVEQLAVIVLDVQVGEEPEHGVEVTIEVDTIYAPEHDTADARDDRNVGGAQ
jgi:hypothetical protein